MTEPTKPAPDFFASLAAARGVAHFDMSGSNAVDPMETFLESDQAGIISRDDIGHFLDNPGRRHRLRAALPSESGNFPSLLLPGTTRYVLATQVTPGFVANCYVALPTAPVPPDELDDEVLGHLFLTFVSHQDRARFRRMRSQYRKSSKGLSESSIRDGAEVAIAMAIR